MELNFDYKEGCYLFSKTSFPEVVIHKTAYKLVTIVFQDYGDYKPFTLKIYDLTNKIDVEILNETYVRTMAEQDPDTRYGIKLGTIVEYDYKQLIYLRMVDKKILNFEFKRPLLFDYIQARDKYLVADALDRVMSLQSEFTLTWEQYFRIPLPSESKIDWDIVSEPIPLNPNINESLLNYELGDKFTDEITVYDILGFIDTEKFNNIPSEEIKNEISNLIKKALEIAKSNQAIGKEDPNKPVIQEPIPAEPKEEEVVSVIPPLENIEPVKKARQKKKTQEEILSQIDEVDPEDLLSLLEEI